MKFVTLTTEKFIDILVQINNTEGARMDEDTALKAAGCKSFGGSIPSSSAKKQIMVKKDRVVLEGSMESSRERMRKIPVTKVNFRLVKKILKRLRK